MPTTVPFFASIVAILLALFPEHDAKIRGDHDSSPGVCCRWISELGSISISDSIPLPLRGERSPIGRGYF
jgi:hypothetical protein